MFLDGVTEDDGVLITVGYDGEKEQSYLLVLDAATFAPLNTAYLPHNIPWSAHGMHFPEATFPITRSWKSEKNTFFYIKYNIVAGII